MATPPVRLDHVAVGASDPAAVVPFLVGELGGRPAGAGPGGEYRFYQWEFAGGAVLELIVPDGTPGGFVERFLEMRGPGVHHVTFKVPDIHAAMDRATALGYDVVGFDDSFPSWKEAFLHPKQAQGIVVQLAESDPEADGVPGPRPDHPPVPAAPPPPVSLVGLRLVAHEEERARRQWQELLCGVASDDANDLVFRWPESPLRIAVDIEPSLTEGPRAIEVASERPITLPEGPHSVLGVPFVLVEV